MLRWLMWLCSVISSSLITLKANYSPFDILLKWLPKLPKLATVPTLLLRPSLSWILIRQAFTKVLCIFLWLFQKIALLCDISWKIGLGKEWSSWLAYALIQPNLKQIELRIEIIADLIVIFTQRSFNYNLLSTRTTTLFKKRKKKNHLSGS